MKIKRDPYPEARRESATTDNYFGTPVSDPYRWLEDDNSTETAQWVQAENAVTEAYLSQIPYRRRLAKRLTELFDYLKYSCPTQQGPYYFFFKNNGLQNQSVLYYQQGLEGAPEPFLDPNTLSEEGTVALTAVTFSKDDQYLAYTVSVSGSDWVEIHVMEIASRKKTDDVIRWVKFSEPAWSDNGFYYSRYDEPTAEGARSGANQHQKVYFHRLGTPQSDDLLIYQDPDHPLRYFFPVVSHDNRHLFIVSSQGTSGNEILVRSLGENTPFKTLLPGFTSDYTLVACTGNRLLLYTNHSAPNFRLVEVNLADETPHLKDLIAEKPELLQGVTTAGDALFAAYLKDASSRIYHYDTRGSLVREIPLPTIGTATGFEGRQQDTHIFYSFSSFNHPPTLFHYCLKTGVSTPFHQRAATFNPNDYLIKQQFYTSKDGTKIPLFLVHRKGLKKEGANPVHMYAYGGFNISSTPTFNPANILFMEQGGIYALVNIRGGGEYGERWHKAGMLENKQRVFDDFIAAGEYLIARGYTSKAKLAISGGSNGGLLVGACITQRPDLFAVAFPRVGVLDMLRYHKFTVGWGWVVEYGSSEASKQQFDFLYRYSPLHNITEGRSYPATMIMTADHDDRVVPAHSFKFGATLQACQGGEQPILVRVDSNAGHGAGKPISKTLEELTDLYSFLFWNTNTVVNFEK